MLQTSRIVFFIVFVAVIFLVFDLIFADHYDQMSQKAKMRFLGK